MIRWIIYFNIELASIKNQMDILNMKNTINGNKNPLGVCNSSLNAAEVRISEAEDRSIGDSKMSDRKKEKKKSTASKTRGIQ